MSNHIVRKQIVLDALPSVVWDALTNPEKTKKYFFGCTVHSTWKEGEPISFRRRIFFIKNIELTGKILTLETNRVLRYTLDNSGASTHSTVTDELTYADGKTTLSITDDVGEGEGAEDRFKKSDKGWDKVLQGLKKIVERKPVLHL
jgi:uncharacterized protein YndB with AHSA1/START domain